MEAGECSLTSTTAGNKTLTATYSGDGELNGSSDTDGHVVNLASTTTTITNDATLSTTATVVGESYLVTWDVTVDVPGVGTPTGTVTVSDGVETCSDAVAAGECTLISTSAGAKTITVTYSGDADFNGSLDSTTHEVDAASTATTITNAASLGSASSVTGEPYAVDVTVAPVGAGSGIPTGTVNVDDGDATCVVTLAGGSGSCLLTSTSAGAKTITATYVATDDFGSSTDAADHTVDAAGTTTTITSDLPDASVSGGEVTVEYSVAVTAPGVGTPTGNVTVSDGTASCTATVPAGACTLTLTGPGTHELTATYSGDADFNASTSAAEDHEVVKADTTTVITNVAPTSTVVGESYAVSWDVTVDLPGSGTPTGMVTVIDGEGNQCVAAVGLGGCALASTARARRR